MALQYQHQQQKKKKKHMPMTSSRSQACVFMLNLSAADFLASICATPWALYVIHGYDWRLGELACGLSLSLFSASVYGSTLFVLLICVERYLATAHPLDFASLRSRRTSLVSSFLGWVLVSLLVAHNFSNIVHRGPDPGREGASYCGLSLTTDFSTARSSVAFFLSFGATTVAPLAVIIPCYARVVGVVLRSERMRRDRRGRARALRLVTAVVTTFLLTFVPLQMFMLGMYVVAWTRLSCADPCQAARAVNAINETVMVLSVMNACTDPFVYFMNETDLAAVWLRGGRGPSLRRRSVRNEDGRWEKVEGKCSFGLRRKHVAHSKNGEEKERWVRTNRPTCDCWSE
ncbi:cysteinyl leukotriene receptor 2-like [Lethenteron reissneri]|uniref:cysteinyl leukotriene receptor 2-like n=1 Tax=Lethenteron reissneri TaxID=7753 RepID=UPI002AB731D9|nr:cysteinyl leukotriene receptor 2-like [Lethenteron reissneri]